MQLTIVEPDPLDISDYHNFTPDPIKALNRKQLEAILIISVIVICIVLLFLVMKKIRENNSRILE